MRVLLLPMGSAGDVYPFVGVGVELRERGHDVTFITNRSFAPLITSLGFRFLTPESLLPLPELFQDPEIWHPIKGWKAAGRMCSLDPMRETYEIIAREYEPGNTVVAAAYSVFGARIAQEKLGVPLATVVLEPDKFRSLRRTALLPRPLMLDDWVPRFAKRMQLTVLDRFFIDPFVGPSVNAFRAELGLPPVRRFLAEWCFSPDRVIAFFPPWYAEPQPDWPPQTLVAGFPRWSPDCSPEVVAEVSRFLDAGDPPIVFVPGSPNRHAHHFFRAAIASCKELNRRGILITKFPEQLPNSLPDDVRHFEFVPLSATLRRSAALVFHGGIGSIADALAAGVPQLIMPMGFNQPDDARRVSRMGVADILPPRRFTASRLTRTLDRLLSSPRAAARCAEIAGRFETASPNRAIAASIEELARSSSAPS